MRLHRLLSVGLAPCLALWSSAAAQDHATVTVGAHPDADDPTVVAWTADGASLVILHEATDDVAFLDAGTLAVVALVDVGEDPVDLELTPDGRYALVVDSGADALRVVDVQTRALVATVPLSGARPYAVEVASDSSIAVVPCFGDGPSTSSVAVVDLGTLSETLHFAAPDQAPHGYPDPERIGVELAGDDRTLLLPLPEVLRLDGYDVLAGTKLGEFDPGLLQGPIAALSDPSGTRAAVLVRAILDEGYFDVYVLDLATFSGTGAGLLFAEWALTQTESFALTPDGSEALVAGLSLHFVDMATAAVVSLPAVPGEAVAVTSDGSTAVVAPYRTADRPLRAIDVATKTFLPDGVASNSGRSIVPHPFDTRLAVLESFVDESVSVVQVTGGQLVELGRAPTGPGIEGDTPAAVAVDPTARFAVTSNEHSDNLTVIDLKQGRPVSWIDVADRPLDIQLFDGGATAVVWHAEGPLSVVDVGSGVVLTSFVTGMRGTVGSAWNPQPARMTRVADDRVMLYRDRHAALIEIAGAASRVRRRIDIPLGPPNDAPRPSSPAGLVGFSQSITDSVLLVDGATLTPLGTIGTINHPKFVTFTEGFAYVVSGAQIQRFELGDPPKSKGTVDIIAAGAVRVDEASGYAYVGTWSFSGPPRKLVVVDVAAMQVALEFDLPQNVVDVELALPHVFVALEDGTLQRYLADGPNTVLLSEHPTRGEPIDLVVAADSRRVLLVKRGRDTVDVFEF